MHILNIFIFCILWVQNAYKFNYIYTSILSTNLKIFGSNMYQNLKSVILYTTRRPNNIFTMQLVPVNNNFLKVLYSLFSY